MSWLAYRKLNPKAKLRLFCFPYAGGGASIFRPWLKYLPQDIEVCPIQLPGRENRLNEKPFNRLTPLIQKLSEVIRPYLDVPFVFLGHSMGALISFELAHHIRFHYKLEPLSLFVSGCRAPNRICRNTRMHQLPTEDFLQELRKFEGMPEEILNHPELMEILIPILRKDFEIVETYKLMEVAPFDYPIFAFGGLKDKEVSREDLEAWRNHTSTSFTLSMLPGGHFFINSERQLFLETLFRNLNEILRKLS